MRLKRTSQMSIYEIFAKHEIADELKKISNWLDAHTEALDWVETDIQSKDLKTTGRIGMTIESILRSGFFVEILAMDIGGTGFSFDGLVVSFSKTITNQAVPRSNLFHRNTMRALHCTRQLP